MGGPHVDTKHKFNRINRWHYLSQALVWFTFGLAIFLLWVLWARGQYCELIGDTECLIPAGEVIRFYLGVE